MSDAGLAHFKDCKNLTHLDLTETQVGDAGLVHLKDCMNLRELKLTDTRVTNAGLAHFKDCKGLTHLDLTRTQVGDAGLAHFKDCKGLWALDLNDTRVTDASLEMLAGLPSLDFLSLHGTRISLIGIEQLKGKLPEALSISWSEPNREAAKQVLALGGTAEISGIGKEARPVKSVDDLPGLYFQVRRISLKGVKQPLGDLPSILSQLRFAEFDRLQALDLTGTALRDFAFLEPIHGLEELTLARMELTDDDLARLPKPAKVRRLVLDGNPIHGPGLAALAEWPALTDLSLGCPTLLDLMAKNLAGLKRLERLSLSGSGLTDAGLKHLYGLTNLKGLDLTGTGVTAAGVADLQKALPGCRITSGPLEE
jgi:Leucine-rich repeat (LRR) protein